MTAAASPPPTMMLRREPKRMASNGCGGFGGVGSPRLYRSAVAHTPLTISLHHPSHFRHQQYISIHFWTDPKAMTTTSIPRGESIACSAIDTHGRYLHTLSMYTHTHRRTNTYRSPNEVNNSNERCGGRGKERTPRRRSDIIMSCVRDKS